MVEPQYTKGLAQLVVALSQELRQLAKDLISGGAFAIKSVQARSLHDRLTDLVLKGTQDHTRITVQLLPTVREVVTHPNRYDWQTVRKVIRNTLTGVDEAIEALRHAERDIALQPFFSKFHKSAMKRRAILEQLLDIDEPATQPQRREIRDLIETYADCVKALEEANDALMKFALQKQKSI